MSHRVMVLDASQRSALAVTRSLGRHGMEVITAEHHTHTIAGASKFSSRSVLYPDPSLQPAAFVKAVDELTSSLGVEAVLPTTDITTMLLVATERPGAARLACPQRDSYETLSDKANLVRLAQELGIPVPRTQVVNSVRAAVEACEHLPLPVVVKPARSRYLHEGRIHSTQVRIAHSLEEARTLLASSTWLNDIPGLLQQYIPGHGAGVFALGDGRDVVAWFAHRRIREKPPSGGVSVLCESVAIDPGVQAIARKLLQAANWFGPAMVEFRVSADGTPYLMEVNGRFWGSLQLAIDSGIDFPWLLYNLLFEHAAPAGQEYVTGRRLRWLLGDLDNLLIQARSRSASKLRAMGAFAATFLDPASRQEVFRWSDPKPQWRELGTWLRSLA